jgi:MAP/microtubule affinity-regulating kinase
MAPEICRNLPFDGEATDVWSLGVTLLVMLTGRLAYERPEHGDTNFNQLVTDFTTYLELTTVQLSGNCINLLKSMLQVQPRLRLTLQEISDHPWLLAG